MKTKNRSKKVHLKEQEANKEIEETINPVPYANSPEFMYNAGEKLRNYYNKHYLESIDNKIDEWHNNDISCSLWEYLGWTREEYKEFVETGKIPQKPL